jgi:NodT family efflux transporter outer membrane factor (OMF) lipoprotein
MIGLVMLFGCAVGPDYVKPSAPTPEAYKEMKGWKEAQPREGVIRGKWWETFNDPGLNALEEQVNISNQNVAAAEAQFRQARALVQAARAAYFPTVSAGPSYTRSRSSSTMVSGSSSSGYISDYLLSFDASWEPDIWGKVRRSVESGEANAQASSADLESARLSAQAELAQDYFQLQALDAQKQLLDTTVSAYQKFLDLTVNRYGSGVASRADVLQAQTQLKTTQAQAIDIGVQRAQTEHAIALLVGKPASDFSIPVMQLAACLPPIPVGVPSDLLERRPDVAGAERRMAAANAQIGVAQAAYYPSITLGASGGYQSSGSAEWLTWPSRFWSVGPAMMETVFDGGLRKALTEQARAVFDANVASYRQTVLTGFQEVEDDLAALRILEEEARVQDEAVTAAQQSVMVTTNQYKAGTASALDVITTQITELNNKKTAISITGNRLTASVLLIKALGGGWSAEALQPATDNHSHGPGNNDKQPPIGIPEKGMMMETK